MDVDSPIETFVITKCRLLFHVRLDEHAMDVSNWAKSLVEVRSLRGSFAMVREIVYERGTIPRMVSKYSYKGGTSMWVVCTQSAIRI